MGQDKIMNNSLSRFLGAGESKWDSHIVKRDDAQIFRRVVCWSVCMWVCKQILLQLYSNIGPYII